MLWQRPSMAQWHAEHHLTWDDAVMGQHAAEGGPGQARPAVGPVTSAARAIASCRLSRP